MKRVRFFCTALLFFSVPRPAASEITVFKNVNLVPMTQDTVAAGQTVIVSQGKISSIGPSSLLPIPEGAKVVDGTGRYLMPGLADMHTHLNEGMFEYSFFNLFLANGVTTIRDLTQGSPPSVLHYRREIESLRRLGPNILAAYTVWGNENDIAGLVESQRNLGYDCLKVNSYFSPEGFDTVMRKAKELGWYTLGHIPQQVGLDGVLASGMNELSHIEELIIFGLLDVDTSGVTDADSFDEMFLEKFHTAARAMLNASTEQIRAKYNDRVIETVRKLRDRDITLTTTMIIHEVTMHKLLDFDKVKSSPTAKYVAPKFWEDVANGNDKHQRMIVKGEERAWFFVYELQNMLLRELKKNQIALVLGTDVGPTYLSLVPGFSVHEELRLLTECGFSPYDAIVTATRRAGEVAGQMTGRNDFGTIEVDKRADFILLERNPLEDVSNIRTPLGVMVGGRWLPRDILSAIITVKSKKIGDLLFQAYSQDGCEATIDRYFHITTNNSHNEYYYSATFLNQLGYKILRSGHVNDAVRIFRLNVEEYPEDWNTFDSYAEALMNAGEKDLAVKNYQQAQRLNPSKENPRKMLQQLQQE